jgi:hypothetical protein
MLTTFPPPKSGIVESPLASAPRGLGVLDRKTGWCYRRALADRFSESHGYWPVAETIWSLSRYR